MRATSSPLPRTRRRRVGERRQRPGRAGPSLTVGRGAAQARVRLDRARGGTRRFAEPAEALAARRTPRSAPAGSTSRPPGAVTPWAMIRRVSAEVAAGAAPEDVRPDDERQPASARRTPLAATSRHLPWPVRRRRRNAKKPDTRSPVEPARVHFPSRVRQQGHHTPGSAARGQASDRPVRSALGTASDERHRKAAACLGAPRSRGHGSWTCASARIARQRTARRLEASLLCTQEPLRARNPP